MQAINTLFVPTFPRLKVRARTLGILTAMSLALTGTAIAGVQHYQATLEQSRWQSSAEKMQCSLSHEIPMYGRAIFSQTAGEALQFTMQVKQRATRNRDRATLRSIPPGWKHHASAMYLDEVAVHKGKTPFQLEGAVPRRMLTELSKGMFPTFSYRDWSDASDLITVALAGVHIKDSLDEFTLCLSRLPVYEFADFANTMIQFDSGKAVLDSAARNKLDELTRYLIGEGDKEVQRIEISGHTDSVGRPKKNDTLSNRRSTVVRDYLVAKGVDSEKFKILSFGENKPLAANDTNQGRAKNRRAQVTLVK